MSKFTLVDEGTLDTVVECNKCGHRDRYNYANAVANSDLQDDEQIDYDDYVDEVIEESESDHECEPEVVVRQTFDKCDTQDCPNSATHIVKRPWYVERYCEECYLEQENAI